jgi:eukaryotic-like serine/threonine-protein kinase
MGDRYTIAERLDAGGMAEVFRGVAESIQGFKKNVAIKRILPSLTKNPKFVSMFLDEAKLSLFLQHANIVQVFDIGHADNTYFLVMEYVHGCNLKALLERMKQKGKRMELAHTIYIATEACKALQYAHHCENPENNESLNIVHRDISPPNILLSKNGEVKLVDFGLAKANSQIESTDPGVVKGKFSYLSPEAASGIEVDKRADIFAVGILLWEMFTGRRLFYGDTDYQTVELVRQARVPSIAAHNQEVEPELEAIVRRALERSPSNRYQEAGDLGDALTQYLFSRRMKVTSRDIGTLVRDVITDRDKQKPKGGGPKGSVLDSLIQEEVGKLTSLLGDDSPALTSGGAESLNPNEFSGDGGGSWSDLSIDGDAGAGEGVAVIHSRARSRAASPAMQQPERNEGDSLQQMLEPDRTGVHGRPEGESSRSVMIALIVVLLLAGAVGAGLFVFKDKIFGSSDAAETTP